MASNPQNVFKKCEIEISKEASESFETIPKQLIVQFYR